MQDVGEEQTTAEADPAPQETKVIKNGLLPDGWNVPVVNEDEAAMGQAGVCDCGMARARALEYDLAHSPAPFAVLTKHPLDKATAKQITVSVIRHGRVHAERRFITQIGTAPGTRSRSRTPWGGWRPSAPRPP